MLTKFVYSNAQTAYRRGTMDKLLSGLRRQMVSVAQDRAARERQQVNKQRQQMRHMLHSGTVAAHKYTRQPEVLSTTYFPTWFVYMVFR